MCDQPTGLRCLGACKHKEILCFSKHIKGFHMKFIIFLNNMYINSQRLPHDSVLYLYKHLGSLPLLRPRRLSISVFCLTLDLITHCIDQINLIIQVFSLTEKRHSLKTPSLKHEGQRLMPEFDTSTFQCSRLSSTRDIIVV